MLLVGTPYFSIDGEKLVSSAYVAMPVSIATRNDTRNVDRTLLLLATHNVEPKSFSSLQTMKKQRTVTRK